MAVEARNDVGANRRIRLGMVGGGRGAFIGAVHRIAARIDDQFELVAGALASDPARANASAQELGIADDRAYGSFEAMAKAEAMRADGIEAVSIVTPNHMHFAVAKLFLEAGVHVICEKPLATSVAEAEELVALVKKTGKVFMVAYNYTGYPMIRQARAMVANGDLGEMRLVQTEYLQVG
jgi:predicted dehydrogenase